MAMTNGAGMREQLARYFKAAFPAVAIQTAEETRACAEVVGAANAVGRKVITWSATEGMIDVSAGAQPLADTEDLAGACRIGMGREDTVFILRDPHTWPFDRDPVMTRTFREFLAGAPANGSTVVILAPQYQPHPTWEKLVTIVDLDLPGPADLQRIASAIAKSASMRYDEDPDVTRALGGLTTTEAENALALSLAEAGRFDPAAIYREKVKAVKRSGLLDIVEPDPRGLDAIGGLHALKAWIGRRRRVWSPEAADFGLPLPKGLLLVGVPGTGKSLSAKAIGTALAVPTLKLDIAALFNSLVGESEARTRDALKLAEALAPCVLWVDEIDKGLAGSGGSGSSDAGVTRRVFGSIISWMQERQRPVFLVATANQVEALPPELLRKGRFDELFAIDLPTRTEREQIWAIHLAARKRDVAAFALDLLAEETNGFTGSEIEAALDEGLFSAFDAGARALTTADLVAAAKTLVPLSKTAKEQIESIRKWAQTRARFASTPEAATPVEAPPIRSLRTVIATTSEEN